MCFSATASFSASAVLIPVGLLCLKQATKLNRAYLPISLLPLVFGIQQAFEGGLWLGLGTANQGLIRITALGFLFFSHFFWLFWMPLSSYMLEQDRRRKNIIKVFIFIGSIYGASLYFPLLVHYTDFTIALINDSIAYQVELIYDPLVPRLLIRAFYALVVLIPLLIATDRYIKYFGILIFISVAFTTIVYKQTFISVWCYFAAILSLYIIFMIYQKSRQKAAMIKS